ncbi:restriction endonuclease subunit S [Staphylococcus aureus]|nr:restriction endonuclease subunit S [Staphylococcus aureus]
MSNTQKKNVPELRFPGFEGEWEEKKLGEVAKIYDGTHQTPKYTNEGIKFLSVENIKTLNSSKYISEEAFEKEFKIRPEFGDILMTRIGDIGTPNIVSSNEKFAYYVSLALLKTKNLNSYFLKNLILSSSIQNELWRKTLHVAFPKKINKNEIGKIKINYPKKQEQQKIGKFFSKLDRQIELEEQKLELLQQQKKGYMQKIFSQELRFKDENGEDYPNWTNERLGEVTTVTMGQSPKSVNYTDNSNDTVLIQGNADIENGLINPRIYTREVTKLIQKDEIILTVRAPVGKLAMAQINACIGRGVCSIKGDKFLYYFLEWFATQNKWIRFSQGSTFESISGNDIRNIHIKIPVEDERTKIIKLLNSLDVLNSKTDLKIQNLKQRKKSLLQKLFI